MKRLQPLVARLVFLSCILLDIFHAGAALAQQGRISTPGPKNEPTTVSIAIWLVDVDSIDSAQQNFVANVYVALMWQDSRLASKSKEQRVYKLTDVWHPRILIANEIGLVRKTMSEEVEVSPEGTVIYRQRYVGPFSQPLDLRDFPFDTHLFQLHFVAPGYQSSQVRFVPDARLVAGGLEYAAGIAKDISLPDWKILDFSTRALPYTVIPGYDTAGYVLEFTAERQARYYLWKIILPLVLIVLMSWSVFLIDPTNSSSKIGVATTAMLTLIAYRFVVDSQVPRVPYLTRLDIFIVAETLLVLSSLFMVTLTAFLVRIEKHAIAFNIERIWRILFLLGFAGILAKTLFF